MYEQHDGVYRLSYKKYRQSTPSSTHGGARYRHFLNIKGLTGIVIKRYTSYTHTHGVRYYLILIV